MWNTSEPDARLAFGQDFLVLPEGMWDIAAGKWEVPFDPAAGCVALGPNGETLVIAEDRVVRLYGKNKGEIRGDSGPITSMRFTPDGRLLLTASSDGGVRVWDPAARALLATAWSLDRGRDWVVVTPEGFSTARLARWGPL